MGRHRGRGTSENADRVADAERQRLAAQARASRVGTPRTLASYARSMTRPAGHDLDQLLAAWAQANQLADADAERIRQAIVPEDLALPATWWSDCNSKVSEAIARATAMPASAIATWP